MKKYPKWFVWLESNPRWHATMAVIWAVAWFLLIRGITDHWLAVGAGFMAGAVRVLWAIYIMEELKNE